MTIEFKYTKDADKFFTKHEDPRRRFKEDIRKIIENDHPETVNYKRLKGKYHNFFRIALDSYRVVFTISNGKIIIVSTVLAGSRGDIYKKLKGKS